jgi:hypothetical protein
MIAHNTTQRNMNKWLNNVNASCFTEGKFPYNILGTGKRFVGFYIDRLNNIVECRSRSRRQVKKICKSNALEGSLAFTKEVKINNSGIYSESGVPSVEAELTLVFRLPSSNHDIVRSVKVAEYGHFLG